MKFDILTIFPHILESYVNESILKRALDKGLIEIAFPDIRAFTDDKHKTVDDTPYGGGPGMILKVEPIFKCLVEVLGKEEVERRVREVKGPPITAGRQKVKVISLSPQGFQFTQKRAEEFSQVHHLVLICGRYEGIDARIKNFIDGEISIGPYVLSGGELPAMVVVEAVTRLLPGVLGSPDSLIVESHAVSDDKKGRATHMVEYPQYTRPEMFEPFAGVAWGVPEVLLSGDHQKVEEWRREMMKRGHL